MVAEAARSLAARTPRPGWVEHDPRDLLNSTRIVLASTLRASGGRARAVGVTTQRSTILIWDRRTGRPLTAAVSWQDRRAVGVCESLAAHASRITRVTGLPLSPHYAAPKLRWLLDRLPGGQRRAEDGGLLCGTVNTFLLWHLSERASFLTDHTQAGRMLLMNLRTLDWDDGLCDLFGVPRIMLPDIRPTLGDFGTITSGSAQLPVLASIGDQQAAAVGQGVVARGDLCLNYGTGAFALCYTGDRLERRPGLLSNVAWSSARRRVYVLEGGVNAVGSGLRWLSDLVGLPGSLAQLDRLAARSRDPARFLPALAGLAAPYWDARAEAVLGGLTLSTSRADLARGFLEGVAFLLHQVVTRAEPAGGYQRVLAGGGLSGVNTLLQAQTDCLGRSILRCRLRETSAWGAAMLAGVGAGLWSSLDEAAGLAKPDRVFRPSRSAPIVAQRIAVWKELARTARKLGAYTEVSHSL